MHGTIPAPSGAAISSAPGNGIEAVPDLGPNPESRTGDWFYDCAVAVFGEVDTGRQLFLATDWARTSCYEFVARDPERRRKPNVEFLRVLFHSPHGAPFIAAFMEGCTAPHWREHQRNVRLAAAAERFKREIGEF